MENFRSDTDVIKAVVTMDEAARKYGFRPNRAGFIRCPFHSGDNSASLKIYPGNRGFCCFGCGASGSVIDFVMLLFALPFKDALERINADFGLGLSMDKPSRAKISAIVQQRQEEAKKREERERKALELFDRECVITSAINLAEIMMQEHRPKRGMEFPPEWVDAAKRLDVLRWKLWLGDQEQENYRREGDPPRRA